MGKKESNPGPPKERPKAPPGPPQLGSAEGCRTFAKRYIERRLKEDHRDAVEELSAYLGDWLYWRSKARQAFVRIEAVEAGERP